MEAQDPPPRPQSLEEEQSEEQSFAPFLLYAHLFSDRIKAGIKPLPEQRYRVFLLFISVIYQTIVLFIVHLLVPDLTNKVHVNSSLSGYKYSSRPYTRFLRPNKTKRQHHTFVVSTLVLITLRGRLLRRSIVAPCLKIHKCIHILCLPICSPSSLDSLEAE